MHYNMYFVAILLHLFRIFTIHNCNKAGYKKAEHNKLDDFEPLIRLPLNILFAYLV